MIELMVDLMRSLKKDGFSDLFCVSGHGDALHKSTLLDGLKRGGSEAGLNAYFVGASAPFKRIGADLEDPHVVPTAAEPERSSPVLRRARRGVRNVADVGVLAGSGPNRRAADAQVRRL